MALTLLSQRRLDHIYTLSIKTCKYYTFRGIMLESLTIFTIFFVLSRICSFRYMYNNFDCKTDVWGQFCLSFIKHFTFELYKGPYKECKVVMHMYDFLVISSKAS